MAANSGQWTLIIGASGGVGASTTAAVLAAAAARQGQPVCLVDGHFGGGGIDVLLGAEQTPGLRWPDFQLAQGHIDMPAVLPSMVQWEGVSVLSALRSASAEIAPGAVHAVLDSLAAASITTILDAPPKFAPQLTGIPEAAVTGVIVTARNLGSIAGGLAAHHQLAEHNISHGVVTTSHQHCAMTPNEVAKALHLNLWGDVRADPRIARVIELGGGPLGTPSRALKDLTRLAASLGHSQMPNRRTGTVLAGSLNSGHT